MRTPDLDLVLDLEAPLARDNVLHFVALLERIFGDDPSERQRDLLDRLLHAERTIADLQTLLRQTR